MAVARYLADTSAMSRMRHPLIRAVLQPLIEQGVVGTCGVLDAEALYSARNATEHATVLGFRRQLPWLSTPDEVWDRAIQVQGLLAVKGQHRAVSIPDLLICATAERHEVTVLHYDADFEIVAAVTGQPVQWVVPRGTADPNS